MNMGEPDDECSTFWTRRVIWLLFFGLPLAMPVHILINHFTHTNWSWTVSLLYPEVLGTLVVLVLARRHVRLVRTWVGILGSDSSLRTIVFLAATFVAWTAVCAVLQGAFAGYWIRSLLIGWIVPALLAAVVLALGPRARSAAWQGLSAGGGVLLAESIVLYFTSFGIPHSFHELVYMNRTYRVWHGLKGGIYLGELTLGSVNDIAVIFAIAIAFATGYSLETARRSRALSGAIVAFVAAAFVLEFLCYSRGVIVSLMLVFVGLTLAAVVSPPLRRRRLGLLILLFVVFFAAAFASGDSRRYWLAQLRLSEGSSAALRHSMWNRAADAESLTKEYREAAPPMMSQAADDAVIRVLPRPAPPLPRPETVAKAATNPAPQAVRADLVAHVGPLTRRLIFGYGLGNYGLIVGFTFEAGTHNMFLDAYVASGVPGLALFSGFWFMVLWRMGREGWRILRERTSPPRDSIVPMPSVLLAFLVITVAGTIVNFKFEALGMMLNAAVVWLLIVTLPDGADEAQGNAGS